MEVVTASILVMTALSALVVTHVSPDLAQSDLLELSVLGDDALRTLDLTDVSGTNAAMYHHSALVMLLSTNDMENLEANLSAILPVTIQFNLMISDGADTIILIQGGMPQDDAITATRLVHLPIHHFDLEGETLQVQLLVWREAR